MTQVDWAALVGIAGIAYDGYVGSVNFIVADQMERVLLPNASAVDVDKAAAALVIKANIACRADLIAKVLQDALNHAPQDIWGYDVSGDGGEALKRLTSLGKCLAQ